MNKLYFKYGAMGCSKTASALMCKFNFEQRGFNVLFLKSFLDNRNMEGEEIIVHSRIGLKSKCVPFTKEQNIIDLFNEKCKSKNYNVIMVDECQFATEQQVEQLKELSQKVPVMCYGLLTDFRTKLFEGSKRLVELADSLQELKSICTCGRKATVNARFVDGKLNLEGDVVAIEKNNVNYETMCYNCFRKLIKK
ncbi:MAG: thymidine kinase [Clostridiales bacterium]|nr:thymidine kinase [Clostridiales bacterium]